MLISLWVPGTVAPGAVEAAVRGAWPRAATTTRPAQAPVPSDVDATVGGHLLPQCPEWLPLRTDHDADPLRALMSAGAQLRGGEYACVQILARPAGPSRAARARRAAGRLREGTSVVPTVNPACPLLELIEFFLPGRPTGRRASASPVSRRDPGLERDVRAILDKAGHQLWETGIRYAVAKADHGGSNRVDGRLRGVADAVASSFAVYAGRNRLSHQVKMAHPVAVVTARRLGPGFLTCTPELAAMAALLRDLAVPGLDRARAKSMPVPVTVPTGGRGVKVLGDANVGGHPVALSVADARYHVHMVGQTGSGKTTLLANMIITDILSGRGTVVLDPHGDLVAGKTLFELSDPDFAAFAVALAEAPTAGADAKSHNSARAFSLHQACYELRICQRPPRMAGRAKATLEQRLQATVTQPKIREVVLRYLTTVAATLRPNTVELRADSLVTFAGLPGRPPPRGS